MTLQPLRFFFLVFLLSVPFYLLGMAGARLIGLALLPASALMAIVPMIWSSPAIGSAPAVATALAIIRL